jgi:hypothetical protein
VEVIIKKLEQSIAIADSRNSGNRALGLDTNIVNLYESVRIAQRLNRQEYGELSHLNIFTQQQLQLFTKGQSLGFRILQGNSLEGQEGGRLITDQKQFCITRLKEGHFKNLVAKMVELSRSIMNIDNISLTAKITPMTTGAAIWEIDEIVQF